MFETHLSHVARGDHARTVAQTSALLSGRRSRQRRRRPATMDAVARVRWANPLSALDIVPGPTSTLLA